MNISGSMSLRMVGKGFWNILTRRPLSVSFEVTHSCTANCWHCNWGGPIKETRLTPDAYGEICRRLDPVVCNVSGGEPLARGDIVEIVRAIAQPGRLPWMVLVTNASQLTPEKFLELKRAGIHQVSVSIDFPDDRHSEFRRIPGLFDRLSRALPECARLGEADDVTLNCCITAWNYPSLPEIVRLARRWGVRLNFSAYTPLRLDEPRGLVGSNGTAAELKKVLEEVISLKRAGMPVYTSERVLWRYYTFLTGGRIPGCKAGVRFLVINPDGRLTPCAMVMAYYYDQATMRREFSRCNTCTACYISTRANSEKTAGEFLLDNLAIFGRLMPWR
jgi:MoaA/NifB/PqqE/SkfB family radical SAM enzyme